MVAIEIFSLKKRKKPENVIGFLREFNFGDRDESARAAVERFIDYIEDRDVLPERLLPGEPKFTDLIIDELNKAGYFNKKRTTKENLLRIVNLFVKVLVKIGLAGHKIISEHDTWTLEARKALDSVLEDFEARGQEWQAEVSKDHPDWRDANN